MTPLGGSRWVEVTSSQFPHEAEGLGPWRGILPDASPFRAWSNFEFRDSQGRWHEVDLLVLGPKQLHLVELKYYSGTLTGDDHQWHREGRRPEDSPLKLARRKAQYFASRLKDELRAWAAHKGVPIPDERAVIPYVQESVFLHHERLRCELSSASAKWLYGLDRFGREVSHLPGISELLLKLVVPPSHRAEPGAHPGAAGWPGSAWCSVANAARARGSSRRRPLPRARTGRTGWPTTGSSTRRGRGSVSRSSRPGAHRRARPGAEAGRARVSGDVPPAARRPARAEHGRLRPPPGRGWALTLSCFRAVLRRWSAHAWPCTSSLRSSASHAGSRVVIHPSRACGLRHGETWGLRATRGNRLIVGREASTLSAMTGLLALLTCIRPLPPGPRACARLPPTCTSTCRRCRSCRRMACVPANICRWRVGAAGQSMVMTILPRVP